MKAIDFELILYEFIEVCKYANVCLSFKEIICEYLSAGSDHILTSLPSKSMAVYIFMDAKCELCYKVGKVGPKSQARYRNHHYLAKSSKSNLANSLLIDPNFMNNLDVHQDVGNWIRENTTRINIVLPREQGMFTLNLLEAFMQCRLNPIYEGYKSQR
ncbi:MAG: hypothetical protein H6582_00025 [Crocinitomicaceae bacterium]|nr:hypothetical protein [Crocinitomicaceae bacterium]HRX30172.1 hypothetical protein [Saprospiraceae bacterium]